MVSNTNTFSYAYASFSSPLYGKVFFTNTKVINPKNNKSVTVTLLADTGAENSQIDGTKFAEPLGIDMKTGEPSKCVGVTESMACYKHVLTIQIPGLQPLTNVPVYLTTATPLFNNLGWNEALEKLQVIVRPKTITYNEIAKAAATAAMGMANAPAYFRSRF